MNLRWLLPAPLTFLVAASAFADAPPYVSATAHHILPETTSEESGYFSLSESLDGAIHVGTAKYGTNSFLVEFAPRTGRQRVVLDTHKTCGLSATGFAAQAKLHTRNFVGRSGKVYVGSKQGYRKDGDTSEYPGGYVMVYDPRTDRAENLGMPLAKEGVIDVVADEARERLYVVTCEEQHWMLGTLAGGPWRELGPLLTPYATTLVDARGVASAITADFQLAQFDPATDRVTTRPILVDSAAWKRVNASSVPTWQLDPDGRHAWLILMNDPTLLRIDLHSAGESVAAESRGMMIEGKNPDSRSALTLHPDGKIYALVRVDNTSGFGSGHLHHLVRYDLAAKRHEDLGMLKVQNPDFFDWDAPGPDGKKKPWTHGFHKLPDGTLTPLHAHMGLLAARDGTLYATILYPYTLLKIDDYKVPAPAPTPAAEYLSALQQKLDKSKGRIPEIAQLAEKLAERHLRGGMIGFPWIGSTLEQELIGRSGGPIYIGFERPWKKDRTPEEKAQDAIIYAWDDTPKAGDLKRLQDDKAKGLFVIGFGARNMPALAEHSAACDAWIDSGTDGDDRAVAFPDGRRVGKTTHFTNGVHGWLLVAEYVAALTRRGKMPPMYRSWMAEDGRAWSEKYGSRGQFHSDVTVPPVAAGELSRRYLARIRYMLARLESTELAHIRTMADRIAMELGEGRKTVVASAGHMVMNYVGRFDDALWAVNHEVSAGADSQLQSYEKTPDGALVLRLDANGLDRSIHELFQRKRQRVLLVTSENPRPEAAIPASYDLRIDPGIPFGDACASLEGYPIPILPPSGVMQVATYESINVEVHARRPQ